MISLSAEELRLLSYAIVYARSSQHVSKHEQDVLSEIMVKVSGEILGEGPHYLVGGGERPAELGENEARRIREMRLNRMRQTRLRRAVGVAEEDS